jgi:putative transposase
MERFFGSAQPLDTIWEIPDALWARIEPILHEDAPPPANPGRPRTDWRKILNGILFRMRTDCQWNNLPKEFGDDSTVHRWFQRWNQNGVRRRILAALVSECDKSQGVDWDWLSADGALGKARFGGDHVGPNPTDRAKNGTKRSMIVDERGGPLGVVVAGANVHDYRLLEETIDAIVVERPKADPEHPQRLCLDRGYDNPTGREAATAADCRVYMQGDMKVRAQGPGRHPKPRRWVVERTFAWLSKHRAILVRYDKHSVNYLGLIRFACALFWYRRLWRLKLA